MQNAQIQDASLSQSSVLLMRCATPCTPLCFLFRSWENARFVFAFYTSWCLSSRRTIHAKNANTGGEELIKMIAIGKVYDKIQQRTVWKLKIYVYRKKDNVYKVCTNNLTNIEWKLQRRVKAIELLSKDAAIFGGLAHQIKSRETTRFLMTKTPILWIDCQERDKETGLRQNKHNSSSWVGGR